MSAKSTAAWLALVLLGAPADALALDRTPDVMPGSPPGGVAIAWPLGIIVALVALMFAVGTLVAHRRRRTGRGSPPPP